VGSTRRSDGQQEQEHAIVSQENVLIRRAAAGERDAFAALFDTHYELIYRIAYKVCSHRADAEDIAQETCLKLARKLHSFRFDSKFTT
jgi:RNA polymerase sigma-70 factor (ECF subfamily)